MRKHIIGLLVFSLIFFSGWGTVLATNISIADNIHVQPVAEFTGSGGYPDIITLANQYLKITSIPKRGRLIHSLVYKPTGNDVIYNVYQTLPMEDNGTFIYEIGGIYLSRPWNPRDVQPYDMEYEILNNSSIKLWGTDFNTKLYTEIIMTLNDDAKAVQININHINSTENEIKTVFWDRFLVNPGYTPEGLYLELPVKKVEIGKSESNWMGNPEFCLPEKQIHFPESDNIDYYGDMVEDLGGVADNVVTNMA